MSTQATDIIPRVCIGHLKNKIMSSGVNPDQAIRSLDQRSKESHLGSQKSTANGNLDVCPP